MSKTVKDLQEEKRNIKKQAQKEKKGPEKDALIDEYKSIQEKIHAQIITERTEMISKRFEKIIGDKSRKEFWEAKRKATQNPSHDSTVIKNDDGIRQFAPENIKETMALYYENLFKNGPIDYHSYHDTIQEKILFYSQDRDFDELSYNDTPTKLEVKEIIMQKKNGKSCPDYKNEMLKRPGDAMLNLIYPLIVVIWEEEVIAKIWNSGFITSLFKGKGDRELLSNHRGITTSSAIGTIVDSIIDRRIESLVEFTPAQGGGRKGMSTCDHLFILRAIISISIHQKRPTFLTFFDVSKAYDHVDNNDLLVTMWEKGLKGKSWRILKELNSSLTAQVKTRFGKTREFAMERGGKQGSRLTGRMFAKMIDLLAEEFLTNNKGFQITSDFIVAVLLWVDDIVSCVEGVEELKEILQVIHTFALKHKIKWSQDKCNVMRIGKHKDNETNWKVGDMAIQETNKYKYLGDVITSDGKNKENLAMRKSRLQGATIKINTTAASEDLNRIETAVILELHEKINVCSLLTNSEAWSLAKGEEVELEKIEINAIKNLFNLPIHIPTVAILYTFGLPYTSFRVHRSLLLYLHRTLIKDDDDWVKKTLLTLKNLDIGWYRNVLTVLELYQLPTDFDEIRRHPPGEWKYKVLSRIEVKNKEKLLQECHKTVDGTETRKTKTASIVDKLNDPYYKREPIPENKQLKKSETRTLMIARYGMLQCGKNLEAP